MINKLLKFGCRMAAIVEHEIGFSTQMDHDQPGISQFYSVRHLQLFNRPARVFALQSNGRPDRGQPISLDQCVQREVLVEPGCQLLRCCRIACLSHGERRHLPHIAVCSKLQCCIGVGTGKLRVARYSLEERSLCLIGRGSFSDRVVQG